MRTTGPTSLETFSERGCSSRSTGWARHQQAVSSLFETTGDICHEMNCQAPSGLSFVMVSNLEEMVVGSRALVVASSVDVTFVPFLFTRDFHDLAISTIFGIMISVLKWEFGPLEAIFLTFLHCACGTCLQPILSGDQAARGGENTRVFMTVGVADTFWHPQFFSESHGSGCRSDHWCKSLGPWPGLS